MIVKKKYAGDSLQVMMPIRKLFDHLLYVKDRDQLIVRGMQVYIPLQSPNVYYLNFGKKDTWVLFRESILSKRKLPI